MVTEMSDLQRHWATFFSEMGWEYQYKPEEFVRASDGLCYAPAFYVHTTQGWYYFDVREDESSDISTLEEYCRESGEEVVVVTGEPSATQYNWMVINSWSEFDEYGRYDRCVWDSNTDCLRYEFYSGEFDFVCVSHWIGAKFIDAVTVARFGEYLA